MPSTRRIFGPATILTGDRAIEAGGVLVREGTIEEVGAFDALLASRPEAQTVDLRGRLILPGLINAHTHLYSAFARGMTVPGEAPTNFVEILERTWWRLDKALEPEDVELSAMVTLAACARAGVTTVIDHHASPNACSGSLDAIARAARTVGVRTCTCYEVSDRDGAAAARAGIDENVRFARAVRDRADPLAAAMFGLHALFTLSDETLEGCVTAARKEGIPLHLHVAEDRADVDRNLDRHGLRPVERLDRHGGLGQPVLVAHCVHANDAEIARLAEAGAFVAHNPESNMGNAVGCAPVAAMLDRDVVVGLGTDGYTVDMFQEIKAASALMRHATGDPRRGLAEVRRMALDNNARIATAAFKTPIGTIEPGAAADLVALDYDPPTPLTPENLAGHLIYGMSAADVVGTVAGGRILYAGGRVTTVDTAELAERARERAARLWERLR